MTKQESDEMVAYFSTRELPGRVDVPGTSISNCSSFVSSNILRMTVGLPIIQDVSYKALAKFRDFLDKK